MSRISLITGVAAATIVASAANAGFESQSWRFADNAGGGGSLSSGAFSVMSIGGGNSGFPGLTYFYTTAYQAGSVSVGWSFSNQDQDPGFDFVGYYLNTTWTDVNTLSGSGTITLNINVGDVYGFGVRTVDGSGGPGNAQFTNFVPTPGAFAVLGISGLMRSRRRR